MTLTTATIRKLRALNLTDEVFDKVLEIIEEAKMKPPKKGDSADRAVRGARLDPKWVLPSKWGQYALQQGLREAEVRAEAEQFRNYWVAKNGPDAIKLDWEATWRNWVIRTAKRLGREPLPCESAPAAAVGPAAFDRGTWEAIMRAYKRTHQWKPEHGPAPGLPRCLVPPDLLIL